MGEKMGQFIFKDHNYSEHALRRTGFDTTLTFRCADKNET